MDSVTFLQKAWYVLVGVLLAGYSILDGFDLGVGPVHYPNLVRAADPALSLTAANASSSPLTLKVMLIIALVGMPVVIGYTVFAYRVFKGKSGAGGGGY